MSKIISPLKLRLQGSAVADLQDALQLLLDQGVLLHENEAARREMAEALKRERDAQSYSETTARLVAAFQKQRAIPETGEVDERTAAALNNAISHSPETPLEFQYLVRGQVLYRRGLPIPGLTVRAFDRELRDEIELGTANTDENGNFEIYYNPNEIRALDKRPGDRPPDLFVRVYEAAAAPGQPGKLLVESPTSFAAQRIVKLRLEVDGGLNKTWSEYEQLSEELKPYLEQVPVGDLVEDEKRQDVTVLTGKLAQPAERVAAFIAANKLAAEVKGEPEVFYALIRKGLPTNLSELLAVAPGTRSRALVAAIRDGLVPGRLTGQVRRIRTQFDEYAITFAAVDKQTAGRARLGAVLKTAIGDQTKVDTLVAKMLTHVGPTSKLWESLSGDPQIGGVITDAQLALQLAAVTGRHIPLLKTLLQQRKEGKFTRLTDFAKWSENDWLDAIDAPGVPEAERVPPSIPGKDAAEKAKVYAATIARIIADTMPTQVFAYKAQSDAGQPEDIKMFWRNVISGVGGFELGRGPVRSHLDLNPQLLQNVATKDTLVRHLEETQRLFTLTHSYDEHVSLRSAGLTSSLAIARLGQGVFLQKMSGTAISPQQGALIYEKAARVSAATLYLATQFSPAFNRLAPTVIPTATVKQSPNLETLFGTFDLCACDQCRSVHGAAAYYADLLAYLGDRLSTTPGVSARDVLFRRRPDLGEIELTCANTNTVLPYSDLVTEILERRIAPFVAFDLPDWRTTATELNAKTISVAVRNAFAAKQLPLAADARVVVGTPSWRWSITDGSILYSVVFYQAYKIRVTDAWPQTSASAATLAAVPQHVNSTAYAVLREQVFPWNLPLDLPTEETRVFLDHLGCPRHELMTDMFNGERTQFPLHDTCIAAEYLKLSDVERQVITKPISPVTPPEVWAYWGLQQNGNAVTVFDAAANGFVDKAVSWIEALGCVRQVLRRSGLEYSELVQVLGCSFVNQNLTVRIVSADPKEPATCDTAKLQLINVTPDVADRFTKFVRLWRKTGLNLEELDRFLVAVCHGGLADSSILFLSHIVRLRTALGRSVDELITFWSLIPTTGTRPLYERLFVNPGVMSPVDPAFAIGANNELAIVVSNPAEAKISRHTPSILAAMNISAADLDALQASGIAQDDNLTLANLSNLYRHALLAECLELSVPDLLLLKSFSVDPFSSTATTVSFADLVAKIRQSGLDIGDLGYLLFHLSGDTATLAPPLGATVELIAEIRRRLKVIRDDTALRPDPEGNNLRRELAALRWPASMIEETIANLGGTAQYVTALDPVPAGFAIPAEFTGRITYDPDAKTLNVFGPLTIKDRDTLKAAFMPANYKAAIDHLFAQPRTFAKSRMRAYNWPIVSARLAALPPGLTFPPTLQARIMFDPALELLTFDGTMTAADKATLDALSTDAAYRAATAALLVAANAFAPIPENQFITSEVADTLFDLPLAADRFATVLAMALARRRTNDATRLVIRLIADAVSMKYRLAERLLTRDLAHPRGAGKKGIDAFLEEPFTSSNPDTVPSEAAFPAPFEITLRMMKIAALVGRMKLSDRIVDWLGDFAAAVPARRVPWRTMSVKWLNLTELPTKQAAIDPVRFGAWLRLFDLSRVGTGLPGGEATAEVVFTEARKPGADAQSVISVLARQTGWNESEVTSLAAALRLVASQDLLDEFGVTRLRDVARRLRRLNTNTAQAQAWAAPAPSADAGIAARRAVQAAYTVDQWPDAMRPLEDKLREKRRAALVCYVVVHPNVAQGENWSDTNGVYSHLLIDVETHPTVLTSRLKQAIGSTQLFVQRCLLNLEPDVIADETKDIGWRQWTWMKQYRVWEANRKIFLFPENWIEPELRDDKSPFFLELENTLLQADVTAEIAELAYTTYLMRLDEVSRLEVAGMFYETGEWAAPDQYHVFARTHSDPPTYFYRQWVGQARWTPWQRLDLDVPGGQILPIIWNRRLYLFWPVFTRKTQQPPAGGDKPVEGQKYFEIQLAWSEFQQGRWGPKKTAPAILQSAIAPDLTLDDEGRRNHVFRATLAGAELLIWYESVASKPPEPPVFDKYGNIVSPGHTVITKGWRFSGYEGRVSLFDHYNIGIFPPPNTHASGMGYEEDANSDGTLQLPKGLSSLFTDAAVALRCPSWNKPFRLVPPWQEHYLRGSLPFFFRGGSQMFFIIPREHSESALLATRPWQIDPKLIDFVNRFYYEPPLIPNGVDAIPQRWNPVPVARYQCPTGAEDWAAPVQMAAGLVAPVVPAQAMGEIALARSTRRMELRPSKGSKKLELVAIGDRKITNVEEFLRPDRMLTPRLLSSSSVTTRRYEFCTHYHPYVSAMIRNLNTSGLDGLLRRSTQLQRVAQFAQVYIPTSLVEMGDPAKKDKYPVEDVDFDFDGAYAGYNWELFFHVPFLIACKLSQNQRFEDAQKWFHAIFDPTDVSSTSIPAKYWRTRPFFEQQDYLKQRIDKLLEALAKGQPDEDLSRQLSEWVANPFRPFAVARVRTVAFQKAIVMKYLDNLIAWGDQLFRRDTIESINEATQLYILAAEILGPRPPVIAPRTEPETHTFNTLAPRFAALTNKLTDIEVIVSSPKVDAVLTSPDSPPLPVPELLYFCVPPNDKLLKYWDIVAERLFKIRNSLNLAGLRRPLPLFEPPIDPMLLVKATAAGVDLSTAIADMAAPAPLYRFQTLVQKSVELCQDVKGLGAALLAAIERRDSEALARIQATHEVALLRRLTAVKEKQITEATDQIATLQAARDLTAARYEHYMALLGYLTVVQSEGSPPVEPSPVGGTQTLEKEGVRLIAQEANELTEMTEASTAEQRATYSDIAANVGYLVPTFTADVKPWGIGAGTAYGGPHVGAALSAMSSLYRSFAVDHRHKAQKASRLAEFIMRANNWKLEATLAAREITRIDKDLAAARIREAIAITDRNNHLKQIEESEEAYDFLRTKYTNRELYDWMTGQLSAVYFQAYQLAYDTARRAERSFRRELATPGTNFIRFGYWDSLRKGLLAGDQLLHDIRRMELAYLDQNAREFEITKHVSLAILHPEGLLELQERGACFLDLPEAIFDLDHPGHYLRRIRSVSVTLPCITGPYTSIPCKLTLLANRIRVDPRPTPQYGLIGPEDQRFEFNSGGIRSVVTSTGRDDPAAFEFNLHDERYLPFEGAGVISSWRLELPGKLPSEFRPFDYRTISDVVLHIRYTARDGGETLRDAATKKMADALKVMEVERGRAGLVRGFSARHEFPDAWQAFTHMPDGVAENPVLAMPITTEQFLYFTSGRSLKISRLVVALLPESGITYDDNDQVKLKLTPPTGAAQSLTLAAQTNRAGGLPMATITLPAAVVVAAPHPGDVARALWKLEVAHISANLGGTVNVNGTELSRIDPTKVADIAVLYGYEV